MVVAGRETSKKYNLQNTQKREKIGIGSETNSKKEKVGENNREKRKREKLTVDCNCKCTRLKCKKLERKKGG